MRPSALLLCLLMQTVYAGDASIDRRVHHVTYREDSIVSLLVSTQPTIIELESGETILDVISDANQLHPNSWYLVWKSPHNYLTVAATRAAQPASLIIKTASHTYLFDMVPKVDMKLLDEERTAKLVVGLADANGVPGRAGAAPLRRNDAYTIEVVHETEDIRPRDVFDDGRFTYMRFPNNLKIPAIYRSVPASKEERLVNSHMDGDLVVLEEVAPLWNLRLGGSLLGIFNERYDSEGVATPSGSTVPGKRRVSQ